MGCRAPYSPEVVLNRMLTGLAWNTLLEEIFGFVVQENIGLPGFVQVALVCSLSFSEAGVWPLKEDMFFICEIRLIGS